MSGTKTAMHRYLALAIFIALVLGGGTLIGLTVQPDGWYAALRKPPFNPPNWVFAPVWSILYIMIGVAGWLVWQRDWRSRMMASWVAQLALNFIWTPAFFGLHAPAAALTIIVALLIVIITFIVRGWSRDPAAALLFLPYATWVAFATLLNAAIVYLN
jgi:tryptophan-rich sensory protein